jgi:uncharacterized protein YfeS
MVTREQALNQRRINDWKRILNMPEGRRVVWNLLQACNFRTHGFVPGDQSATAFHCGQISIGLYIADKIRDANFSALEQMEQEYVAEIKQISKEMEDVEDL